MKYGLDVRYRHRFGKLTAVGLVGYAGLSFKIDKGAAPEGVVVDVPNVNYHSIDPGVLVSYQLGRLALLGDARAMLMLGAGEIQKGEQYGVAKVLGLDANLGLEYAITGKITAAAYFRYQRIGFTFKGGGELTDRDGDGETDVASAADLYVGGLLTAGYRF
jgi:hypothetical protein